MAWELKQCKDSEYTPDSSGVYMVINRIVRREHSGAYSINKITVRVDIMSTNDEPLMSFVGAGDAVRKDVIRWLQKSVLAAGMQVSTEHASYIGYEVARAMQDEHYVQG